MRLLRNWRAVLRRAWSVRHMLLTAVLSMQCAHICDIERSSPTNLNLFQRLSW